MTQTSDIVAAGKLNGSSFANGDLSAEAARVALNAAKVDMKATLIQIGEDKALLAEYSAAWRGAYQVKAKCSAEAARTMFKNKKSQAISGRETLRPTEKPKAVTAQGVRVTSTVGRGTTVSPAIIAAAQHASSVGLKGDAQMSYWLSDVAASLKALAPHVSILSKDAQKAFARAQTSNGVAIGLCARGDKG